MIGAEVEEELSKTMYQDPMIGAASSATTSTTPEEPSAIAATPPDPNDQPP